MPSGLWWFGGIGHTVADVELVEDVGWAGCVVAELATELLHVGADGLVAAGVAVVPDIVEQGSVGDDPSCVEGEEAQQFVLGGGEVDHTAGKAYLPAFVIDGEIAEVEGGGAGAQALSTTSDKIMSRSRLALMRRLAALSLEIRSRKTSISCLSGSVLVNVPSSAMPARAFRQSPNRSDPGRDSRPGRADRPDRQLRWGHISIKTR